METKEALDSSDWLNISGESILEFLDMECLIIKEADLVRALIRWGKFQLEQQHRDNVEENLRSKILPGLRKIRFDSINHQEFAQLCTEEFGEVLTGDEKCSVFVAIIKGNWEMMPTDVVSSSKLTLRHEPCTFCAFSFDQMPELHIHNIADGILTFNFQTNKNVAIIGVKLNLTACLHETLTSIKLVTTLNGENTLIGSGDPKSTAVFKGEMFYKICTTQSLAAQTKYTISLTFATSQDGFLIRENKAYTTYVLPKDKNQSCADGLAVEIFNRNDSIFYVDIQGILFEKVRCP
jgi:hypothetical protein